MVHGLLQVSYSGRRGFSLSITKPGTKSKNSHKAPNPPASFISLSSTSKTRSCWTTHELNALNGRLQAASDDCLKLTETVSAMSASWHSTGICQLQPKMYLLLCS